MKKRISSKIFILLLAMCSVLMLFTTAASADEPDADGYINGTIFCHISEKGDGCENMSTDRMSLMRCMPAAGLI